jgi:pyruvate/2-oxoglutarate dehydrogenase complex dihydrolipoamide acyltransferase (E2) component
MLQPYLLTSPVDGQLESVLKQGTTVKVGMMLSRIKTADNQVAEIRAPLAGEIESVAVTVGTTIKIGDAMLFIAPDSSSVWEALRALYFVGEADDIVLVAKYANGFDKMPDQIKEQAALTAKAIQSRSGKSLPK